MKSAETRELKICREKREKLASLLIAWMRREIGSCKLDDAIFAKGGPAVSIFEDHGLSNCCTLIWCTYDDFTDHVFDCSDTRTWSALLRALAFLRSDIGTAHFAKRRWFRMPADDDPIWDCQPFSSIDDWKAHSHLVAEELSWTIPMKIDRAESQRLAEVVKDFLVET